MDRFWEKVRVAGPGECWEWEAGTFWDGYGQFGVDRVPARAHRVAYELEVGPIPEGFFVLHDCDNPACVNPAHLHLGTQADNVAEMVERERIAKGESNPSSKLTRFEVLAIRELYTHGVFTYADLGEMFGVHKVTVGTIIRRESWSHV